MPTQDCFRPSPDDPDKCANYVHPDKGQHFCGITSDPCPTMGMSLDWHRQEAKMWSY